MFVFHGAMDQQFQNYMYSRTEQMSNILQEREARFLTAGERSYEKKRKRKKGKARINSVVLDQNGSYQYGHMLLIYVYMERYKLCILIYTHHVYIMCVHMYIMCVHKYNQLCAERAQKQCNSSNNEHLAPTYCFVNTILQSKGIKAPRTNC